MRVLFLAGYFPKPHNTTMGVWSYKQAKALQDQGVDVIVISPSPWIPKITAVTPKLKDWATVPDEYIWGGLKTYYPKCLYYPTNKIRKLYHRIPFIWLWPMWYTVRRLISREKLNPDLIYCQHPLIEGMVGLFIKQEYKIPLAIILHNMPDIEHAMEIDMYRKAYVKVLKESDAIMAVSDRIARMTMELLEDKQKPVAMIRNGVDLKKVSFEEISKPNHYHNKKVILSVGWLEERKGHRILIQAIKQVSLSITNVKCIIVGRGSQESQLRDQISELKLNDYIEIIDNIPHDELIKYMSWCDIFALPSWDEPFGVVYLEAMSCKTPIIGTKNEGISEIIEEGKNGLLVEPKSVESLTEALLTLLKDDEYARRLGEEGYKLVSSGLTWRENAIKTIAVFQEIIQIRNQIV